MACLVDRESVTATGARGPFRRKGERARPREKMTMMHGKCLAGGRLARREAAHATAARVQPKAARDAERERRRGAAEGLRRSCNF